MKAICVCVFATALLTLPSSPMALAAEQCPPEVAAANTMLTKATAAASKATARAQETQAPRQLAGVRQQDIEVPRGQEVQAPKQQDVQAPRGQDVQAPRLADARKLVREAEAACKKGDMALSASKAKEAMELLK
jgi:hypothetical protein